MPRKRNSTLIATGSIGLIGIISGGFGAHLLQGRLTQKQQSAWNTAVQFNLIHAAALMAVSAALKSIDPDGRAARHLTRAFYLLLVGTALFSGSIYAMCVGAPPKRVGPLTPIGGITLMLGWISVAVAGF